MLTMNLMPDLGSVDIEVVVADLIMLVMSLSLVSSGCAAIFGDTLQYVFSVSCAQPCPWFVSFALF